MYSSVQHLLKYKPLMWRRKGWWTEWQSKLPCPPHCPDLGLEQAVSKVERWRRRGQLTFNLPAVQDRPRMGVSGGQNYFRHGFRISALISDFRHWFWISALISDFRHWFQISGMDFRFQVRFQISEISAHSHRIQNSGQALHLLTAHYK